MDSPFNDILHTNAAPSDTERQTIHDLLRGPLREIARLQESLDDLTRKRDELQRFVDAHLALVSPVRRLPADVVREIFVATLPSDRNCVIKADEPPILLCKICRAWRILALSTPRLWTSLHIVAPAASQLERLTSVVDTWLSRSGVLPLSLSLVISQHIQISPDFDVSMLLETLMRYSSQWKHVRISLPSSQLFSPLDKLAPAQLLMLEHACIQYWDTVSTPSHSTFAFLAAPNITSVSLGYWFRDLPGIRWESLRHLAFDRFGPFVPALTVLEIFGQCALLESCAISIWAEPEDELPRIPCHLEYMQDLRVSVGYNNTGLLSLFAMLKMPNLRLLEYITPAGRSDDQIMPFLPLLSSAHSVDLFTYNGYCWTPRLVHALQLMPMLQELRLTQEPASISPATQLVPLLTSDSGLCPQLRYIHLKALSTLSEPDLLKFIQARTGPHLHNVAHLASVRAQFYRTMVVDIMTPLRQLVAEGLDVSLIYQKDPGWDASDSIQSYSSDLAPFSTEYIWQ